ncbi:hypothetical protein ABFV99_13395 [Cytobacillus horneckiae]|uniref:hypothetical protein n=1 Tax=Cytobacillus horneckiae TaxID=549687 RepID=UPI0034CD2156
MTPYKNREQPPKNTVNVYIGEEEWQNYSYENKLRLLYRLKHSESLLSLGFEPLVTLIEEEQREKEIDYDATLKNIEENE